MNPSYIHKSRFLMCHVGHKSVTALALRYFVSVTLNERLDCADCCFEFAEFNRSREKIAVMVLAASCAMDTALTVSTGSTLTNGENRVDFLFLWHLTNVK